MDFESIASTIPPLGLLADIRDNRYKGIQKSGLSKILRIFVRLYEKKMFGSSNIIVRQDFGGLERKLHKYKSVYVVCDGNVRQYADTIVGTVLRKRFNGLENRYLEIEATESSKTLATVERIARYLMDRGAGRDALLLSIGGGTTSDIVGFAAAIYKRGIAWANVPTTLLSQVDAAIGGKTGVNLDSFKNMLGAVHRPEFTYINTRVLETLPEREFNSGAAELLKTFIIKDEGNYEKAVAAIASRYTEQLPELIEAAAKFKEGVARKDPYDRGARRVLNLGHTYGHAVEWYQHKDGETASQWAYKHGEAVAIGIIKAARMSEERGIAVPGLSDKLVADFASCRLPVSFPCDEKLLRDAILQDKKVEGGKINFVFIKEIGKVEIKKITL